MRTFVLKNSSNVSIFRRMRRFLATLAAFTVMVGAAFGQTDHGYNIFGQLFGPSTVVGVGLDSRFKTGGVLGYSVGLGFTNVSCDNDPESLAATYRDVKSCGLSIPLEVNAIFGNRASKFEVGVGLTGFLVHRDELKINAVYVPEDGNFSDYVFNREEKSVFRPNIMGTISLGYRLQRKSGFFMKLGLTFLVGDISCSPIDGLTVLPNICLGYTIPHF